MGTPYEKKYVELKEDTRLKIINTIHNWQTQDNEYEDIPEFSYSATIDEIREKEYTLVPSQYIEFINNDGDFDFDEEMSILKSEFEDLLKKDKESMDELLNIFEVLGYEIQL